MGVGTDIGGSIRSPAANNGIYGLRPSIRCIDEVAINTLNNTFNKEKQ
ncbi:unnamed protein product [Rotaria sp. Silwood1]|nr:unnamed protein product [Rotaria sp. Silwood1]